MSDILNALNAGIYSRLQGGTALTSLLSGTAAIYSIQAPESADLPYLVYSVQGGGDENLTPNRTQNILLFVRAYSGTSGAAAGSIDAQIDARLHMGTVTVTGWQTFWLARESAFQSIETTPAGEFVWCTGGLYRVRLDAE